MSVCKEVESPLTWCDEGTDSSVGAFCKMGLWVGCGFLFWLFLVQWVVSCVSCAALYYHLTLFELNYS